MHAQEFLGQALESNKMLLTRYLVGFDDSTHTRQAPGLPNHVAWSLGHLAMTMHRTAEKLDGRPIPSADFIAGATAGDASRYGTETVAFGSSPVDDAALYPTLARATEIYNAACDRIARAVRAATDDQLAAPIAWGNAQVPTGMIAARMIFHNGAHTGQIADLRRALGMKRVLG